MKYPDNSRLNILSVFSLSLVIWIGLGGCTTTEIRKVFITPTVLPAESTENKISVSAALVLDKPFKEYGTPVNLVGATAIYVLGDHLSRYAVDVSRYLFRHVVVYDSMEVAVNKADVILVPKVARSSMFLTKPRVLLVVEWLVKDRTGQQTLWLTSIEAEAAETKYSKLGKACQRVFDDLSLKTLKAFDASPEIKRLTIR